MPHLTPETAVTVEQLREFCLAALQRCGIDGERAETVVDVLVTTDTWGVHTHGTKQLRPLLQLRPDRMDPDAEPEVAGEGPAWAIIDGRQAPAMITSTKAMKLAIEKARNAGIACAAVRNCHHFGAAGYYATLALPEDMIGIAMSNTDPLVAVPGGRGAILGTNPFAYAVPAGNEKPIFLDIATSVVAASKIVTAKNLGKEIPPGWLIDDRGQVTTDPSGYPEHGALLTMAGHKGYGFNLMIEIFCALLSGADIMRDIKLWLKKHPGPLSQGHTFLAVNIAALTPVELFKERMDDLIRHIKNSPRAEGVERIYLPGEKEWEYREHVLTHGLKLPDDVIERLTGLAHDCDLKIEQFF